MSDSSTSSEYIESPIKRYRNKQKQTTWLQNVQGRTLHGTSKIRNQGLIRNFIPNSRGTIVKDICSRIYSGQFTEDSKYFFCCTQDFTILFFDSYTHEIIKTIQGGPIGQWTITDSVISNNNRILAYSSITSTVYLGDIEQEKITTSLDFRQSNSEYDFMAFEDFGIWSLRFSHDNRELAVGTSDNTIKIMDIETQKIVINERQHKEEINAICFLDSTNSNVLISGSDDSLIKVWDRRIMSLNNDNSRNNSVGLFIGHVEGITFVSPKGDGRHLTSNSKDQTLKLWDIRMMASKNDEMIDELERLDIGPTLEWDYRFMDYPISPKSRSHPLDNSVRTFYGHKVLKTLIRCHFSPETITGKNYIYSGSEDGIIHIYSLQDDNDGPYKTINCNSAIESIEDELFRPNMIPSNPDQEDRRFSSLIELLYGSFHHYTSRGLVVRDVSWHPYEPSIIASCWKGREGRIVKHKYVI